MTIPFRRDHSDADRLNDLLDAMRSGTRAPDATNEEASELARTARQFRGLSDRATSTAPAPAATFDAIWEDMMSAHAISAPTPVDTGPTTHITPETHRVPTVPGMPKTSRLQSLLSAAIVVLMLAGLVATAWNLRGTNGGTTDPNDSSRLAATAMQDGTPEASPGVTADEDAFWMEYMVPGYRNCPPTDRSTEQDTEPSANLPDREYLPLSEPAPDVATDVARIAREWRDCGGSTHLGSRFEAPIYMDDALVEQLAAAWPMQDPTDFVLLSHQEPDFGIGASINLNFIATHTFVPDHAVQLADGRIGVPISLLVWADDPNAPINPDGTIQMADWFRTELVILVEEEGEWKVDEIVMMCIGDCENIFGETLFPIPTPETTPTIAAPTPTPVPRGSSEGIAPGEIDFTSYVTPEECRSEPLTAAQYAQIIGNREGWPVPEYGPASSPDESDARAAATAGREYLACKRSDAVGIYSSDAYLWRTMSDHSPIYYYVDRAEHIEGNGREVSAELSDIAPSDLIIEAAGQPPSGANSPKYTYLPQYAYEFPDGRIGLVPITLVPAGTSPESMELPAAWYTTMTVLSDDTGSWMVDDFLDICIGDCDDYTNGGPWNGNELVQPTETAGSTPDGSSTPGAGSEAWLQPTLAEDCTDPSAMNTPADSTDQQYGPVSTPSQTDAETVAEAARLNEACSADNRSGERTPIRDRWAVYFNVVNAPGSSRDVMVQHQLDVAQELSPQLQSQDPADYIHESDANLELNPEPVFLPEQAIQLADGRIAIPMSYLVPRNAEPDPGFWVSDDSSALAIEIQIFRSVDGQWVMDESIPWGCVGDCEESWNQLSEVLFLTMPDATPASTPAASADWQSWVQPEECTIEPMGQDEIASILSSPDNPDRSYTVSGPANPASAQAAVDAARTWRACIEYQMEDQHRGVETDAFIRMWEANFSETQPGFRAQRAGLGQELSPQLDMLTASDFVVVTAVEPPQELLDVWEGNTTGPGAMVNSLTYNPDAAFVLDDGRILIPETMLIWDTETPRSDESHQISSQSILTGQVIILANEDGRWKVDELLYICLGECDVFWAGFSSPASPTATPEE